MENKWTALSESLPESRTVDVLFQNDEWITDCDREDLEQLIKELDNLKNKMKAL